MRHFWSGCGWITGRALLGGTALGVAFILPGCGDGTGPGGDEPACPSLPAALASYLFIGNADDASGNGNHGTVLGATLTTDRFGKANRAYSFDGEDDAITIGNGVQPAFPLTVSLWFNVDEMRFAHVFSNDDVNDASNRWGVGLLLTETGSVASNTYEGFSAPWNRVSYSTETDNLFGPGAWHHVVVVFNANQDREIYFDGQAHALTSDGSGSSMQYGGGSGMIGRVHGSNVPKFQFAGSLDDILVFDVALTAQQVSELYSVPEGCF